MNASRAAVLVAATLMWGFACPMRAQALCGDPSRDGRITATDALVALHEAVEGRYDALADVMHGGSADGLVRATDALEILKAAVASVVPACAAATDTRAVVVTASSSFASGNVVEIDFDTLDPQSTGVVVAGDTVVRSSRGRLFLLNRFAGNNLHEVDPDNGYRTLRQCSTGKGSNPHDVVLVSDTKGYVTRYDSTSLAVVDLSVGSDCVGFVRSTIDLSSLADADGIPEMDQMLLLGDRLLVSLQLLDRSDLFHPSGPGKLAVIDTTDDRLVGSIDLAIANPFAETKGLLFDGSAGRIYVGGPGRLFDDLDDGGIEAVDATSLQSLGVLLTGAELGGDLLDFVLVGDSRGYAIVADGELRNRLVAFDLTSHAVTAVLATSAESFSDIEVTEGGELWLADRSFTAGAEPGLRRFSVLDDSELAPGPIFPGLLPFNLLFLP